ncbi:MAG: NAD(P)-binding domain-containing protein [Alphaproteobacteria bacterium]
MPLNTAPRVGVIGLGNMGSALADALIARGFDVTVWNRTPARTERFAKASVKVAHTVAEAAGAVDCLVMCLLDHAATMASVATDGVATALRGKALIQLTTMTPVQSMEIGRWAVEKGVQ